jgi:hypothetical protein
LLRCWKQQDLSIYVSLKDNLSGAPWRARGEVSICVLLLRSKIT